MGSADDLRGVARFSIGLLCAAAFVLILIILSGSDIDDTSAKAIGTAAALAFLSLTAVAGSHLSLRQPQLALFGYLMILISGLAFIVTAAAIWSVTDESEPAIYCLVVAMAGGHTSVLLARADEHDSDGVRLVRGGTIACLWLLVAIVIGEISTDGRDLSPQAMGVVAVLYGLGSVVLPLLHRTAPKLERQDGLQIDHVIVAASDCNRSDRFYSEGLGASVRSGPEGKVCFIWPGTAESAVIHLANRGIQVVDGPAVRSGAHGVGVGVCCRDPDGNLIELISYR